MELVAQDDLPELMQLLPGIRLIKHLPGHHRVPLQVLQRKLRLPVVSLVSGHRGIGAPMVFQIQFSLPCGQEPVSGDILFQFFKKLPGMRLMCLRAARNAFFHPAAVFKHLLGRTAASVSIAVDHQRFRLKFFLSVPLPVALHLRGVKQGVVGRVMLCQETALHRRGIVVPAGGKMCQHF